MCVEDCFRRLSPALAEKEEEEAAGGPSKDGSEPGSAGVAPPGAEKRFVPSSEAFDEEMSGHLVTAVIRSLRFFRSAAAGTEAASAPGHQARGRHTPGVRVLPDGSVSVDDGPRQVALAGLRLAGAVATAPGPARALLAAGGFHVLWRLPSDPAATPAGVALALGALCQGVRHADVLRVFLARREDNEAMAAGGLAQLGGYEACAVVLSGQVRMKGEKIV